MFTYFVLDDATLVLVRTRNPPFTSVDTSKGFQTDILVKIQLMSSLLGKKHLKWQMMLHTFSITTPIGCVELNANNSWTHIYIIYNYKYIYMTLYDYNALIHDFKWPLFRFSDAKILAITSKMFQLKVKRFHQTYLRITLGQSISLLRPWGWV